MRAHDGGPKTKAEESTTVTDYSRVQIDAMRRALDGLSSVGSTGGYGTNHDANAPVPPKPSSQVVVENGRPVRARTADLHRVKVAL
jgi:hypothetical protein